MLAFSFSLAFGFAFAAFSIALATLAFSFPFSFLGNVALLVVFAFALAFFAFHCAPALHWGFLVFWSRFRAIGLSLCQLLFRKTALAFGLVRLNNFFSIKTSYPPNPVFSGG